MSWNGNQGRCVHFPEFEFRSNPELLGDFNNLGQFSLILPKNYNHIDYERFNSLNKELRCPKCQSSSLDGSNSPISKDLKNQVHKLILEGKTDDEIKSYLIARYGDYIVYEPRFNSTTLVLSLIHI